MPSSHSLPDGTRVTLRPIERGDKARLSVAHSRFSDETIRRRFLAAKPRVSSAELRYLTEIDGHNHIALVAVPADDPESIVGVARCVRLPEQPDTAEFAIVVGDPFQRRGLGSLLARTLADSAREAGIRRFAATMFDENVAVQRLIATITAQQAEDRRAAGVREVVVDLAA